MAITYGISIDNDYTITNISGGGGGGSYEQIAVTVSTTGKETLENADWLQDLLSGTDLYCEISGTGTVLDNKIYYVEDITSGTVFELTMLSNERPTQGAASGTVKFLRKPPIFDFSVSDFDVAFDFRNNSRLNNQSPSLNPNESVLTKFGTVNYSAAGDNLGYYESTGSSGYFEFNDTQQNLPMFTSDCTRFEMLVDIDVKVSTNRVVFDNTGGDNETNGMYIAYTASSGTVAYKYSNNHVIAFDSSNTISTGSTRIRLEITQTYDGSDTRTIILANGQQVVDDTQSAADERIATSNVNDNTEFPASSSGSIYRFIGWKKSN